ncbi:MAG TPA: GYF domain-containing protein [Vicinamibacteria bacterium]|nr:GYF domain-containing protein [Vicinamibacteria bacterium]
MSGWKVRLGDGSEIGPMDLAALRTWLAQGLVDGDSPVMRPGSRKWVALGTVQELKGALGATRPKAAPRPTRRRQAAAESEAVVESDEASTADLWRVRLVGVVLLVAAAGLGLLAWRPALAAPAFDGAPWMQIALAALALGLALLPGWNLGRRGVRVALLLVAFALFPLAGILIAQGERGTGLLALASAWVLVSGLAALLPRTMGRAAVVAALVPVLAAGYGAWRFGRAPANDAAEEVREWASADRRYTDDALGLTLDIPEGWVALKPGSRLVAAPSEARLTLAQLRHGGFGYLVCEPAPRGVATADQYLDQLVARRRAERPELKPGLRANALVGSLAGRRHDSTWLDGGVPQREVAVAGLDGWMGFALVAWMPEAAASRPGGLDALARSLAARGLLAARLREAVEAVVSGVPHLSAPVAEQLMAQSEARVLEPDQAFRRSLAALARLLPALSKEETRELTGLTTATYAGVPWADRARLAGYVERVRKVETTRPEEDRDMAALMRAAEEKLTPARLLRLQAYYEKAIRTEY